MMDLYCDEVMRACTTVGVDAAKISSAETAVVREQIIQRYCGPRKGVSLWESFHNYSSVHDPEIWRYAGSLLTDENVIMLFEEDRDEHGVRIGQGSKLTDVLGECIGFEFYVTNDEGDFVLCLNRFDMLLGVGKAGEWVERFIAERSKR